MRRIVLALLVVSWLLGFSQQVLALGETGETTHSLRRAPLEQSVWVRSSTVARDALRPPERGAPQPLDLSFRRPAPAPLAAAETRVGNRRPTIPSRRLLRHQSAPPGDAESA